MLVGRRDECRQLDELLDRVRNGVSQTLVIRGEAGIGKSALLEYLIGRAGSYRIVQAAGVQEEAELAFAGLHQLCTPLLHRLDRIPGPQQDALGTAFGLRTGPAPDPFWLGLAVLSLLAEAAAECPVVCIIDDAQWLDHASAQTLAFVARQLGAESVALVFANRDSAEEPSALSGLPALVLDGLGRDAARELLAAEIPGPLDEQVRQRIFAETRGNPLALLELPQGLTYAELAGGFGLPDAQELSERIEESFQRRLAPLRSDIRQLLLIAAAEPTGDPELIHRAAARLGVPVDAPERTDFAGLLRWESTLAFRHPLARSAVYGSASVNERRAAHGALAAVTDPAIDADRRAWHFAHSAGGPDESIAQELEHSADRARARGGLAAAAAFLERAAVLTPDPPQRAGRALAAAATKFHAGAFDAARDLLAMAVVGPLSEFDQARVDLMKGHLAWVTSRGGNAPLLLVRAAERLAPVEPGLSRTTYLDALSAAMFAGHLAGPGGGALEVARAAAAAPRPTDVPRTPDLLLDGLAANFNQGYPAAVPSLRQALAAFGEGMSADEQLRWLWLSTLAALHLWDDKPWHELSDQFVQLARGAGALSELPLALSTRAIMLLFVGDLNTATSLVDEQQAVTAATGGNLAPYSGMALAALAGREDEVRSLIESTVEEVGARGEGIGIAVAHWTNALLHNGLGNYPVAMAAAQQALAYQGYPDARYPGVANWAVAELMEAAALSGASEIAAEAFNWIEEMTRASRTDWALGLEARSRALICNTDRAESLYLEAIERLRRTLVRTELARTRLLYGEWLRRQGRRVDAREQLRAAYDMLTQIGAEAFAERARRELVATGEKARRRTVTTGVQLTGREIQVARMASDGLSNPEIGTRLLVSPRTVEYHLGNVFAKLGITSRHELDAALAGSTSRAEGRKSPPSRGFNRGLPGGERPSIDATMWR
jgi:DNA-binding CsgD family transcriptional regulator